MVIGVSGATGFVGTRLCELLVGSGHRVVELRRHLFLSRNEDNLVLSVAQCDVVVNLAGAPINHRWSQDYVKELYDSRIAVTRSLVKAMNSLGNVSLFVSTSAVGYYPSDGGCYDEQSAAQGTGVLADLCAAWEGEARQVQSDTRLVIARFGVVLADGGGAFVKLAQGPRMGVIPILGSGRQPFAWIDREDLVRALVLMIEHGTYSGVFNMVAPEQLTHAQAMRAIGRHYRAKLAVHIPAVVLRMAMGRAASFVVDGQCVLSARLREFGFSFRSPSIELFLKNLQK